MSVFFLIFISSLLCYSHARPQESAQASTAAKANVSSSSDGSSESLPVNPFQSEIDGFLKAMNSATNTYLKPIMANMTATDQQEMINLVTDGMSSYVNYMLYILGESTGVNYPGASAGEYDDEVIIEFESVALLVPGIPKTGSTTA